MPRGDRVANWQFSERVFVGCWPVSFASSKKEISSNKSL